jgi:hypothetical protein
MVSYIARSRDTACPKKRAPPARPGSNREWILLLGLDPLLRMSSRSVLCRPCVVACCIGACLLASCLGTTTLKVTKVSPDGEYRANLYEGDTGAVGGWMSAVRLSEVSPNLWTKLRGSGQATVFGGEFPSTGLSIAWKGEKQLLIVCDSCDVRSVQVRKSIWKDVRISYELRQ